MSRKTKDKIIMALIYLATLATVGILFWILIYVVKNGIGHINQQFLFDVGDGENGILPMIFSTLYIVALAIGISVPIGIMTSIYTVEYAKKGRFLNFIRFAIESLAAVPSIIFGLFGMLLFVVVLKLGWSLLSGSLTVSIMVLPTIIRTSEEAIKAVPESYRNASYALGVGKLETILKVVLPSAMPGILTSVILSIGRIFGETAAIYLTAGMTPAYPESIMDSGRTLAVHLYLLAKEGISFDKAFATGAMLMFIILMINLLSKLVVKVFSRKLLV
jgi:phosphate transport system permease protein